MSVEKGEIAKAVATGLVTGWAANAFIQSFFLHRAETHRSIKLNPSVREVARFATWLMAPMKPREWVGVHLRHHANPDQPERIVAGKVIIPADPHSPKLNEPHGRIKVLLCNVPMYRRASKEVQRANDYSKRLEPDKLDKLYDKGYLGQIALYGLFTSVLGPLPAAVALAAHDGYIVWCGGKTNASHDADKPTTRDGSYARNLHPIITFLTGGEGDHANHHENPRSLQIASNPWLDPPAALGRLLIKAGLAEPGARETA